MKNTPEYIHVAGVRCLVNDTSALEAFLIMHNLRRVLCGGEDFPGKRGSLAVVASVPLMQKEIDFIASMQGTLPSVATFMDQHGVVGVVDYEVVASTDLPGWDGTPNPVVLSNPRWLREGKLLPVPPDILLDDERRGERRRGQRPSGRRRG